MNTRRMAMLSLAVYSCASARVALADHPTESGDPEVIEVARTYLDAYQDLDVKVLSGLYAPDVRFVDETSLDVLDPAFIFEGREAVLNAIEQTAEFFVCVRYRVRTIFEASGRVVFSGRIRGLVRTRDGLFTQSGRIVTILSIEGGLVTEHRDYYAYNGLTTRRVGPGAEQRLCGSPPGTRLGGAGSR